MEKKIIHECTQSHTYTHTQKMKKQMYNRKQEHVLLNGATFIISFVLHVTLVLLLQHSHVLCLFTLFFYFLFSSHTSTSQFYLSTSSLVTRFFYYYFSLLHLVFFFSFLLQFHRVFLEMSCFFAIFKQTHKQDVVYTHIYIHTYL